MQVAKSDFLKLSIPLHAKTIKALIKLRRWFSIFLKMDFVKNMWIWSELLQFAIPWKYLQEMVGFQIKLN